VLFFYFVPNTTRDFFNIISKLSLTLFLRDKDVVSLGVKPCPFRSNAVPVHEGVGGRVAVRQWTTLTLLT
jgi:hypothetical protein